MPSRAKSRSRRQTAPSGGSRLRRAPGVSWRVIEGDEGVLLDQRSGDYFSVNAIGLKIWQLMDGKRTLDAIERALAQEYGVSQDRVARDLKDFSATLTRERLATTA